MLIFFLFFYLVYILFFKNLLRWYGRSRDRESYRWVSIKRYIQYVHVQIAINRNIGETFKLAVKLPTCKFNKMHAQCFFYELSMRFRLLYMLITEISPQLAQENSSSPGVWTLHASKLFHSEWDSIATDCFNDHIVRNPELVGRHEEQNPIWIKLRLLKVTLVCLKN